MQNIKREINLQIDIFSYWKFTLTEIQIVSFPYWTSVHTGYHIVSFPDWTFVHTDLQIDSFQYQTHKNSRLSHLHIEHLFTQTSRLSHFILNTCSHRLIRLHTNPLTRIHINERCFRHWAFASLSINTITKRHNAIINTHNTLKQVTETFFFLSWWAARRREDFCVSRPWGIYTWICFHVKSKTHKQWNRQRYCINDLRSRADIRQKCWALKSITRVTTLTKKPLGGRNSGNHWNLQKQYY